MRSYALTPLNRAHMQNSVVVDAGEIIVKTTKRQVLSNQLTTKTYRHPYILVVSLKTTIITNGHSPDLSACMTTRSRRIYISKNNNYY